MSTATADDVQVTTTRAPKTATRRKVQPPYVVIVENDDFHTFDYVIEVLQKVCGHNEQEAGRLALEIHETGRAAVWQGVREVAELKRDQISGYGPDPYARRPVNFPLGCYIEPLPG
jgi:ATP-dependent Clp protease adaptor protein ClpS